MRRQYPYHRERRTAQKYFPQSTREVQQSCSSSYVSEAEFDKMIRCVRFLKFLGSVIGNILVRRIAQGRIKREEMIEFSVTILDINSRKGPSERCVGWLFVDVGR